jgi:hypothetical protein
MVRPSSYFPTRRFTFGDNAALLARYIFEQMKVTMNLQGILQTPAIVQWTSRCISCKITHSSSLSCGYPKRSSLSCGKKKKKKTQEKRGKRDDMWTHLYYPGTQRFPFSKTKKKNTEVSFDWIWWKLLGEKWERKTTRLYPTVCHGYSQHLLQMRIEQSISAQQISKRNEQRIKKIQKD